MKYLYAIALLFAYLGLSAQVNDDFSDGDFTTNPTWTGDNEKFIINPENELQLHDTSKLSPAYLCTPSTSINNASWEFYVRFDFDPSSTNYAKFYLCSDNSNLTENLNGYYVKIGNTEDEVSLYKQEGSISTEIIDGIDNRLSSSLVTVRIRVNRDEIGNWTLASDTTGGTNYQTEGSVFDNSFVSSTFSGFLCNFTSTRWDKIFLDDILISGDPYADDIAPILNNHETLSNTQILLSFSEPMDDVSVLNPANYQINNGINNPASCEFYNGNPSKILLNLNPPIQTNTSYTLMYQGLYDLYENPIEPGSVDFALVETSEYDIVLNEVMADPNPTVLLPDAEYIELYNRKDFPINLNGWQLIIGDNVHNFPGISINANAYLIICRSENEAMLSAYGNTAPFSSFGVYAIPNSGSSIELRNTDSLLIDKINYTEDWYQHPDKKDGGWSIERIDPDNHCSGMSNWGASTNEQGGTPGNINSIDGDYIDNSAPKILSWEISSANEITLNFSEAPDSATLMNYDNYNLSPEYGTPLFISQDENNALSLHLQFVAAFQENTYYTLSVSNLSDVCGNQMQDTSFSFINYIAETFEVLITEIMTDPNPAVYLPEAEYIELYNMAAYPINLAGWQLISGSSSCTLPAIEIPVGGYLCLTDESDFADFSGMENIVGVENFPSLNNTSGEIKLISKENKLIHFVNYTDNWYESQIKSEGGWSLEIIDKNNPCGTNDNWGESVSETGGTPAMQNSIHGDNPDIHTPEIVRAIIMEPDSLIVFFNESLHPDYIPEFSNFIVDQGIGEAISIVHPQNNMNTLCLAFQNAFVKDIIYTLNVYDNIPDCSDNSVDNSRVSFALPDSVEANDIIINEILFNPYDGASDYIELYNNSNKFINLSDLRLATLNDSLLIDDAEIITETGYILFPDEFVVLSEDINSVSTNYYCKNPDFLFEVDKLPSYGNESGDVIICTRNLQLIDKVHYHDDMHFRLLKSTDGIALERISYNKASEDKTNWHSAAETAGFGTPTYKNSQNLSANSTKKHFELSPESISPDNDGYQDYLNIYYSMEQAGYMMSISIYNAAGHHIRQLTDNELMGTEGTFQWDGLNDNNQHPGAGIYIILLDYFDLSGNRHQEKYTCVVAVMQ